ncbi:MAG: Bug family tripartite tricarboxylate transporter substrate binding protein [Beijerinckiaceae bacterium]
MRNIITASAATLLTACGATCAAAETIEDFYKGKTVSLVVSSATGGGYDSLARLVSRFLPKHIPGNPQVVVRNMPGAGGITATNHLYTVAARDGTVIGAVQNNTPFEPLFGTKQANYDARKFNWLGSPSVETGLLTVWAASPVKTLADAQKSELKLGSSGANSTPSFYGRLMNSTLGLKLRMIVGYPGQNDALIAMERGELDGYPSAFYNSLMATRPTWIPEGKVNLLVQYGAEKEPQLPGVPFIFDVLKTDTDRALWRVAVAPLGTGRPYLLPPETPADKVAAMRKAFRDAITDKEFLSEQEKMKLGADTPRSGEQVLAIIEEAYKASPDIIEQIKKLQRQD